MSVTPDRGHRPQEPGFRRSRSSTSGFLTPSLLAILCAVLLAAAFERGRGHYQRLRSHVVTVDPGVAGPTGPGGQPPLVIRRTVSTTSQPELLSATLLPGRGMNVLQITASIPGHGELPLLFSPDLAAISQSLTASGADAYGAVSSTFGGAIAVPWARQLAGVATANRSVLQGVWQGQRLTFPAATDSSNLSTEGLLLNRGADSVETSSVPGGKVAQAVFHGGSFGGSWPSSLEVSVQAELMERDFELSVNVKNIGQAPSPVGIGWHPFFALGPGDRRRVLLSVPAALRLPSDERSVSSAETPVPVAGSAFDFSSPHGAPLGTASLNTTYLHLQKGILADGPVIELRDPAQGFALRLTPLTENIRYLRVVAPAEQPWVALEPTTNLENPLARTGATRESEGLATLQPGDSLRWRVRLEIVRLP